MLNHCLKKVRLKKKTLLFIKMKLIRKFLNLKLRNFKLNLEIIHNVFRVNMG